MECVAYLFVVQFQKRGLPHALILIILYQDSRLYIRLKTQRILFVQKFHHILLDSLLDQICTKQATRMQNIVLSQMRHGPVWNIESKLAMNDQYKLRKRSSKYKKQYPKCSFLDTYPKYRRKDLQNTVEDLLTQERIWTSPKFLGRGI